MTPPAASHAHAAPPLAPRRRTGPPPRPRRVSGPARRPAPATPQRRAQGGLALGLIGLAGRLDALASHRLLDRLIRGRVWIGIVAFALIGIVTLQLGLLRLNSGIGRSLEREAALQSQNASLSLENSELSAGTRVESQAGQLGMRLVAVGGLQFLGSHARADISHAVAALQAAATHETASTAAPASTASSEESSQEGGGEGAEASATEAASEPSAESSSAAESSAPSTSSSETAAPSAGTEASSETSSEAVPAGEGGGAAAPGG